MQLTTLLTLGLALTSTTSGYVVTLYSGGNCNGATQKRNVWDNKCATRKNSFLARSARVEAYGGWGQKARFHNDKGDGNCVLATKFRGPYDAHSANGAWKKGGCIDFGGQVAYAFGSFAV